MLSIADWTHEQIKRVGGHSLRLLTVNDDNVPVGREKSTAVLPFHYVSERRIEEAFRTLGKTAVADLLRMKLPGTTRIRSGDLGEILATEYIDERTRYAVPIRRLRWKDHREVSMRGDDVIGIYDAGNERPLRLLKAEAKSRVSLSDSTVAEARKSLDRNDGLPSQHALSYVADRLLELGKDAVADAITRAQLVAGVRQDQVEHLIFTFTGNAPHDYLVAGLRAYTQRIPQTAVGLRIKDHQAFIQDVFDDAMDKHGS